MNDHAATEEGDVKLFDIMTRETEAVLIWKMLIEECDHIAEQLVLVVAIDRLEAKLIDIGLAVVPEKANRKTDDLSELRIDPGTFQIALFGGLIRDL